MWVNLVSMETLGDSRYFCLVFLSSWMHRALLSCHRTVTRLGNTAVLPLKATFPDVLTERPPHTVLPVLAGLLYFLLRPGGLSGLNIPSSQVTRSITGYYTLVTLWVRTAVLLLLLLLLCVPTWALCHSLGPGQALVVSALSLALKRTQGGLDGTLEMVSWARDVWSPGQQSHHANRFMSPRQKGCCSCGHLSTLSFPCDPILGQVLMSLDGHCLR